MFGCKKPPTDYRIKFLGNYTFSINETLWTFPSTTTTTQYNYEGKVEVGSQNNTVIITYSNGRFVEPIIYEEGTLETSGGFFTFFSGEFESETKVKFQTSTFQPGYNASYDIIGEKK
jgi:hypothetical protein